MTDGELRCRICDGPAPPENWVDLSRLPGRLWLCPTHKVGAVFMVAESGAVVYTNGTSRLSLGPYRYGEGMFAGGETSL